MPFTPHLTVYDNLAFGLRRMPLQPGEGHPTSVGEKGAVVADHSPETSGPYNSSGHVRCPANTGVVAGGAGGAYPSIAPRVTVSIAPGALG
jgi:hypothetical protein